jgi:membrane protein
MASPTHPPRAQGLRETITRFIEDDSIGEAAALSFFTMLSLVPLVLIVVGVAGLAWGDEAAAGQLSRQVREVVGPEAAEVIESVIANAGRSRGGPAAVGIGIVTLLMGATGAVVRLKSALNRIWQVAPDHSRSMVRQFLHARLISLIIVLSAGCVLVGTLMTSAFFAALRRTAAEQSHEQVPPPEWEGAVTMWLGIALLLFLIYRILPDAQVPIRSAVVGALATTILLGLGRTLVGVYIQRAGISTAYGAAGSLVVLVVWIFYSYLSLLLGAEATRASTRLWERRPAADRATT